MPYSKQKLNSIYDKTDGCCHLCHRKLSFKNYGVYEARGAWHVEHSVPRAKGGTDHLNNLFPACIDCNLEKKTMHTKTIRARNGVTRAPYSKGKKQRIRDERILAGAMGGALIGAALFGPVGFVAGSIAGGIWSENGVPNR